VSFAIGLLKKGVAGGLLSGMLFQYPGLLMMSLIGWGAEAADWENRYFKGDDDDGGDDALWPLPCAPALLLRALT
jgi:hypothetical protein